MAKAMLTPETTTEEALKLVKAGKIDIEAYQEWDEGRQKRNSRNGSVAEKQIENDEFLEKAKPLTLDVAGQRVVLEPRSFASGSVGFGYFGKVTIDIGDQPLKLQASISLVVTGSKTTKGKVKKA